ncbi:helix-turn-helix domain-containing protein [Lutibaculum baratangense]|uniref:Transcriptional regulator, AraC family n=1 Tax=Lutibaculum baratangense AMV1 TaxID=631454 RepID=V4R913_9HYPH|nr:helix-turn-helix domain-containing protein [Lutibaculum baratangense]ESR22686.1 Transcriptional regulator, AraC family [Lutibaculum baratangense AMV1]
MSSESPTSFDLRALSGAERFEMWSTLVRPLFDVRLPDGSDVETFRGEASTVLLGDVVIARTSGDGQHFSRTSGTIRDSGWDHLVIQCYDRGAYAGDLAGQEVVVGSGEIGVLDLARPFETFASAFSNLTLVIPREKFVSLRPSGIHGLKVDGTRPLARIIRAHMGFMAAEGHRLDLAEAAACTDALVALVTGAATADAPPGVRAAAAASARATALDFVDRNLDSPGLSPDRIAEACGISRATLYRILEMDGGIAAFIRDRRLARALDLLAGGAAERRSVERIAFDVGFTSAAHFSRAFKARFGVRPSDVPELAREGAAVVAALKADTRAARWLADMRALRASLG